MKKTFILSVLSLFTILNSEAQILNAWVLGDGEKVFREDNSHPDRNGNSIWDGKTIRLRGLYNEVLAFQVIVEAPLEGTKSVEVSVDNPVQKESGKAIGGNTLKYGPAGTIEIFSEHYLQVIDSTKALWFYGSKSSAPEVMTGWIPDPLIPTDAFRGRGGFPLDIPSVGVKDKKFINKKFQNQGFWIDIHLPRDQKSFKPGIYKGSVKIIEKGKTFREIPLEITLLPAYLTDKNPTNIWLFNDNYAQYFQGMSKENFDIMIKFEAHRHRMNLSGGFKVNSMPFNADSMNAYKPYLDGSAFTPKNGYNGPGEGTSEAIFPIGMYGTKVLGDTKEELWKQSDLWVDWFEKNAPSITYFLYIIDEPTAPAYPFIKEKAGWLKSNPGPGKKLPVFTTSHYQDELNDYIDIWAGFDGADMKYVKQLRDKGGDYWFYNGVRPRTGTVILEAKAADFIVNCWIMYKYGISEWFIWESTVWTGGSGRMRAGLHQRLFSDPLVFINDSLNFANGGGSGFYPGRMPYYPDEDRGLNQILSSVRFKEIRRGQQDAAIMWMAEQKAGRDKVLKIINRIVPKAMYEVDTNDKVPWSETGDEYDRVRQELLDLL